MIKEHPRGTINHPSPKNNSPVVRWEGARVNKEEQVLDTENLFSPHSRPGWPLIALGLLERWPPVTEHDASPLATIRQAGTEELRSASHYRESRVLAVNSTKARCSWCWLAGQTSNASATPTNQQQRGCPGSAAVSPGIIKQVVSCFIWLHFRPQRSGGVSYILMLSYNSHFWICFFCYAAVSLSLSLSLSHTHRHTQTHTHKHRSCGSFLYGLRFSFRCKRPVPNISCERKAGRWKTDT